MTDYIIGIDLGGTNIKGALLNKKGLILEKIQITTDAQKGAQVVLERILQVVRDLMQLGKIQKCDLMGIGIGIPGQIDYSQGKVIFAPNLGWNDVSVKEIIEKATGLPVFLDNDGNVAALGEMWCGAGRGFQNIIVITVGTGIGGGIILDGRILRGVNGSAGEVGHMIMQENGPLCNCGKRGCLETLTAAPAILRQVREALQAGNESSLAALAQLEAKDVFVAAERGDDVALNIVNKAAYWLGLAIANLLNVFNPELIIIGGGVAKAGDILIDPIREIAMANALEVAVRNVNIVPAQLGNDAGCIGAGALVLHS